MTHGGFKDLLRTAASRHSCGRSSWAHSTTTCIKIDRVDCCASARAADGGRRASICRWPAPFSWLPFLLFSGYSGHLADAISKRKVLIGVKVFEIFAMVLGLAAFFSTRIELMLFVLFLMALHSTVFSPAKYGIVPEMLPTGTSRAPTRCSR